MRIERSCRKFCLRESSLRKLRRWNNLERRWQKAIETWHMDCLSLEDDMNTMGKKNVFDYTTMVNEAANIFPLGPINIWEEILKLK